MYKLVCNKLMDCCNCQYPVHIFQLVNVRISFSNVVLMLSKGDLVYVLFTLETTPLCDDNYLPPVSNWKDRNSNDSKKWTGEGGISIKKCVQCTYVPYSYLRTITVNQICLPFSIVLAKTSYYRFCLRLSCGTKN